MHAEKFYGLKGSRKVEGSDDRNGRSRLSKGE